MPSRRSSSSARCSPPRSPRPGSARPWACSPSPSLRSTCSAAFSSRGECWRCSGRRRRRRRPPWRRLRERASPFSGELVDRRRRGGVMSMNVVTLLYLVASICFIQALKGLSHATTSIRGDVFGMVGMGIAVATTAALIVKIAGGSGLGMVWVLLGLVVGGAYGAYRARTVEMTQMPELVAFFHSMIGLAAVFIAVAAVAERDRQDAE